MLTKSTTTTDGDIKGKKGKKNPKQSSEQVKKIRIINIFLESLLSVLCRAGNHSLPYLPTMPSNTVLIYGPAVGAAQILIWFYSCGFLPPMSIDIGTSMFSLWELSKAFFIYSIGSESA